MCFNQGDAISLNVKPLKLVDQFTYNVNIYIGKAWTAIDKLYIKWKLDLSNKIEILPNCSHVSNTV